MTEPYRCVVIDPPWAVRWAGAIQDRSKGELCLLAVRGKTSKPEIRDTPSVVFCPKSRHSEKPQLAFDAISRVSPAPRLEVFCRTKRPGWDAWGNQLEDTLLTIGESA